MIRPSTRGFTLLEAVLTITLLAITASLALPSFGGALARYRLRGAAEALAAEMALARQAAAGRDAPAYLVARTGDQWCVGVAASPDSDCNGSSVSHVLRADAFPGVKLIASSGQLGDGALTQSNSERATALFSSAQGDRLRVAMTPLGRASICSATASIGFATCAPDVPSRK
jgi:type IV fimbrial biogenesis protein FimT